MRRDPRSHGSGPQHRRLADHRGGPVAAGGHSSGDRFDGCFNAHLNYSSLETMPNLLRLRATSPCVNVRANWVAVSSGDGTPLGSYHIQIQFNAPAMENAAILISQGAIDPSSIPAWMNAPRRRSIFLL